MCIRHNAAKIGFFLCSEWLHAEDCCLVDKPWQGPQELIRSFEVCRKTDWTLGLLLNLLSPISNIDMIRVTSL